VGELDTLTSAPPLSVFDAAKQVFAEQTAALRRHAKGARKGKDPEAVHQMRVATRRLRAALRALTGRVAAPKALRGRLQWLGRRLGAVRDLDVILALLRSERLPAAAAGERSRLARLIRRLDGRREKAQHRLTKALRRDRYEKLQGDLDAFAERPRVIGTDEPVAARVLASVSTRLGDAIADHAGMTQAAPTAVELHALRIEFKRLRYALEFHAVACGFTYDTERRLAREMQDVLGEIHDRDLLLAWLGGGRGPFRGSWPALAARLTAERARLVRRFLRQRRAWQKRTRPEPLATLAEPRWSQLEPQPVTLRLVTGTRTVASRTAKSGW
jgi:CHAD domain-containing protein